ncbi:MAG: hypothetical protein K9K65_04815 [Desulfarculaceae bacterium]|nr:hypothetical protein [Desulfarculaceae bacterium]MCF8097145.1 hypothetical protein [Desulfarculaceae bacterium]
MALEPFLLAYLVLTKVGSDQAGLAAQDTSQAMEAIGEGAEKLKEGLVEQFEPFIDEALASAQAGEDGGPGK